MQQDSNGAQPAVVRASAETYLKHQDLVRCLRWHQESTRFQYHDSRLFIDTTASCGIYDGVNNDYGYAGIGSPLIACGAYNQLDIPWSVVCIERKEVVFEMLKKAMLHFNCRHKVKLIDGDHNDPEVLQEIIEFIEVKRYRRPGGLIYFDPFGAKPFPVEMFAFLNTQLPRLDNLMHLPAAAFKRGSNGDGMQLRNHLSSILKQELVVHYRPAKHQWVTIFMTNDSRVAERMCERYSSHLPGDTYRGDEAWHYLEQDLCLTNRQKNDKHIIKLRKEKMARAARSLRASTDA